jgi:hypothetical protein
MSYWIAAHLVIVLHFGFVFFVVLGGFMAWRWRWVLFLHIPAALWGALIEYQGWVCPLTPLEQRLRKEAGQAGYSGGFIEQYLLPVLYPSSLSREMQVTLATLVIVINMVAYGWMIGRGRRK